MQLIEAIGNTPLIELKHAAPKPQVKVYGKMEGDNPAGSVKDRPAYNMIAQALQRGEIQPGDTLVEATSGNTGIALAMAANLLDVKMILIMPESATEERKQTMRAYGAELILTPAHKTIEYSRVYARQLAEEKGLPLLNQFDNPDNWKAHYHTTGPEIWEDTDGGITHFVSAMGTTGTITGVGRYLKEHNPAIQIIGAQPSEGSKIPGIRAWSPELLPAIFDPSVVDEKVYLDQSEAEEGARALARTEGILTGASGGGAYVIARRVAARLQQGKVVFVVCDRGDRYLSSGLFG
ncbi:MAG: cysteine synthase CysM [Schleiferiaceae bacterium]|nr:cysteine synthase CysM [Schleiferiaceae bacterium]